MRQFLVFVLAIGVAAPSVTAASQACAGGARIRACSLRTRDLVLKVSPAQNTRLLDQFPPEEEEIGVNTNAIVPKLR